MKNYKFINNITGWLVFVIAAVVYLLTIEPTTSFWDCGEFIASAYKMEVGHSPGNSMFMLVGRFFTLFAPSAQTVAITINAMSAICSALCILFLFWSITHLARRIYANNDKQPTFNETLAIMGAGLVGALAYTFTDTFWFSAVEGEVYAMSSLFTALVFWAILKWEEQADEKFANRWLILLAYLMGISIGVHLLNLLALPAIVFVYYFKKYQVTTKGVLATLGVSVLILFVAVFAIIPGLPQIGKVFELFFVNTLGLPINSGLAFYIFFALAMLSMGIYYTYQPKKSTANVIIALFGVLVLVFIYAFTQSLLPVFSSLLFLAVCVLVIRYANRNRVLLNTVLLSVTMFILGYLSLVTIVVRSEANTPMNENQPDNVFSLIYYINREQYGDTPLFYGKSFASPEKFEGRQPVIQYRTIYYKDTKDGKDVYNSQSFFKGYEYHSDYNMLFPRLYSTNEAHIYEYARWTDMTIPRDKNGRYTYDPNWRGPTMSDNLKYMFKYQFNWMYWRYFMWNYVGRQNDIQGRGNSFNGNWITGIPFLDDVRLGIKTDDLPDYLKENKGYNRYFLLPFILGLFGLFFQLSRDKKNFTVVFLLFIMTGLAIAFYLNMPPNQPRERDYVFAGSTYAFAIWIGFGVLAMYEFFRKYLKSSVVAPVLATLIGMVIPVLMAAQNWDDHDRSNRYTARDMPHNFLSACGKNAILVTFGDNDTFPLWYLQEVEEQYTDVRVINTSLLAGDWYIDQMRKKVYDSDPVPFSLPHELYVSENNQLVDINERTSRPLTAKQVIEFISNPKNRKPNGGIYIPTRTIAVPVDKKAVIANNILPVSDTARMVDTIYLKLNAGKQYVTKSELMLLDLFANYKWDRPVCFSSVGDLEIGHHEYLRFDGFVYRFVPVYTSPNESEFINTDILYDNLMNKCRWGNMDKEGVLIDYHNMLQMCIFQSVRGAFARLAQALMAEGKNDKVVEVLDRCLQITPRNPFFYNMSRRENEVAIMAMVQMYYQVGATEKANILFDEFVAETNKCLRFFANMNGSSGVDELKSNLQYLYQMASIATQCGEQERAQEVKNTIEIYLEMFNIQ